MDAAGSIVANDVNIKMGLGINNSNNSTIT